MKNGKDSRHVLFAVISYSSLVEWEMTLALHTAAKELSANGIRSSIMCAHGMADLCRARNGLFAAFIDSGATDMLCIDSDVSWSPGSVERILQHPVDFVFGAYPLKTDGAAAGYAVRGFEGQTDKVFCVDPTTGKEMEGGLVLVQGGPAGFLRITRACAEQMVKAYPDRWYTDISTPLGKAWNLFEFGFSAEEHRRWSEDIEFGRKFMEIGGQVWLDPWLMFQHHGRKAYRGCIGMNWVDIKERAEQEAALNRGRRIQAIEAQAIGAMRDAT